MAEAIQVLHVDDDGDLLELASLYVEQASDTLTVETATDPTDVAAQIRGNGASIDCIVSDYDMPQLDGLELLEIIATERPDLPFILFTGKGSEEIASEAISLGVTDYMQKEMGTDQYEILANRIENVVERRRAEEDLRRRESVFRTLAQQDIVGIYILNDGTFSYVNAKFADIFGYSQSEIIGMEPHELAASDDRELVDERVNERLKGETESHHYTFTGRHKDGAQFPIEVCGGRTVLNSQPSIVGCLIRRD